MRPFAYQAPTTIEEAVAALAEAGDGARPLAGGTDLIVQLRHRTREADLLVDVKRIPELLSIHFDANGELLGAESHRENE